MLDSKRSIKRIGGSSPILFIGSLTVFCFLFIIIGSANGQTTTPADGNVTWGGYNVTSTTEIGWRWRRLSGNENKYRSDLDYKQGLRSFDTNLLLESDSGKGKYFDSLLISNTGWGSDRFGSTRVNVEKTGVYRFNGNVRRIAYFNNLSNHVLGQHTSDTQNTMGDFDFVAMPQNEKIRFNFGYSFSNFNGPGVWTIRAYSDEFPVTNTTKNRSNDFRVGAEGKLFGFNWGITQGFRLFRDRSAYEITSLSPGNNPTNTSALSSFSRIFPTDGTGYYTAGNLQRTIAKKLDFSARLIYTETRSRMSMVEIIKGRDNSNNQVDLDRFDITSLAKRIQMRGDIGLTYNFNDRFRISNTFSYDRFTVNGGEALEEALYRRNNAGTPLATSLVRSGAYRVNDYDRYVNTIEGDFQVNNAVAGHIGYRYTHRKVNVTGYDITLTSAPSTTNPKFYNEEESNSTHAVIAGMKIKPIKNWVVFWDAEHGTADNVFSRLENYQYTNFRVRSRITAKNFAFNASAISRDNTNPSESLTVPPLDFGAVIKSRVYSGSVDWEASSKLAFNAGYTYRHMTANTAIQVSVATGRVFGFSQYFVRDNYANLDVSAKPHKRVSFFGSYRISLDRGQGTRFSALPQFIITSYPMKMHSPEFRLAFRITRNVDWNVGYQYFKYRDDQTLTQNYKAHLPYTSLRIYFGGRAADR